MFVGFVALVRPFWKGRLLIAVVEVKNLLEGTVIAAFKTGREAFETVKAVSSAGHLKKLNKMGRMSIDYDFSKWHLNSAKTGTRLAIRIVEVWNPVVFRKQKRL